MKTCKKKSLGQGDQILLRQEIGTSKKFAKKFSTICFRNISKMISIFWKLNLNSSRTYAQYYTKVLLVFSLGFFKIFLQKLNIIPRFYPEFYKGFSKFSSKRFHNLLKFFFKLAIKFSQIYSKRLQINFSNYAKFL